jgi:hypothetical protein
VHVGRRNEQVMATAAALNSLAVARKIRGRRALCAAVVRALRRRLAFVASCDARCAKAPQRRGADGGLGKEAQSTRRDVAQERDGRFRQTIGEMQ